MHEISLLTTYTQYGTIGDMAMLVSKLVAPPLEEELVNEVTREDG